MTNIFVDTEGNRFEGTDFFDHETQQWLVALKPLVEEPKSEWEVDYIYPNEDSDRAVGITVEIKGGSTELALIAHTMRAVLWFLYTDENITGDDLANVSTTLLGERKNIQNSKGKL